MLKLILYIEENNMGWLTLDEFKNITGIVIDDDTITIGLTSARKQIIKKIFITSLMTS